jgi:hypothetical protein
MYNITWRNRRYQNATSWLQVSDKSLSGKNLTRRSMYFGKEQYNLWCNRPIKII